MPRQRNGQIKELEEEKKGHDWGSLRDEKRKSECWKGVGGQRKCRIEIKESLGGGKFCNKKRKKRKIKGMRLDGNYPR